MRNVRLLAGFVILVMIAMALNIAVNDSMNHGVGLDTFLAGVTSPWQAFINQDLVSGLLLMTGWIIFRQRGARVIDTVAWIWLALWWGNIVVASYVLVAAAQSDGDWGRFFMGSHAAPIERRAAALRLLPPRIGQILFLTAAALMAAYLVTSVVQIASNPVAVIGYLAGFLPIVLGFLLLAFPRSRGTIP